MAVSEKADLVKQVNDLSVEVRNDICDGKYPAIFMSPETLRKNNWW